MANSKTLRRNASLRRIPTLSEFIIPAELSSISEKPVETIDSTLKFYFGFLGFVSLSSWNYVLTSLYYMNGKIGHNFGDAVPLLFAVAVNSAQLLILQYGPSVPFERRMGVGCVARSAAHMGIGILSMVAVGSTMELSVGLLLVFLLGLAHSLIDSVTYGLASLCPPSAMTMLMIGQAIAGVTSWPLNEVCGWIAGGSPEWQCILFSGVPTAVTLAAGPLFHYFIQEHPFIREKLWSLESFDTVSTEEFQEGLLNGDYTMDLPPQVRRPVLYVVKDCAPMAILAWIISLTTLWVFPSTLLNWQAVGVSSFSLVPRLVFTFQMSDCIGRVLPWKLTARTLTCLGLIRLLLVPIFILLSADPFTTLFPAGEIWKHLLILVFGVSHGFCCMWSMILGSNQVHITTEREIAGYTMSFATMNGILSGSLLGLITKLMI